MASPRFHSQRSEILLNVSADHSSSPFTPRPRPRSREAPVASQSPITRFVQSESKIPGSVERVEDSYQEFLPKDLPLQPAIADDEEDLYGLSPRGRASLDATLAARRSAQKAQLIEMPKRNAIEAFLDAGATVPSSGCGLVTTSKGSAVAWSAGDNATLDAITKAEDTSLAATLPEKRDKDGNRKLQTSSIQTERPRRAPDKGQSFKDGIVLSGREPKPVEEFAHAQRGFDDVSICRDRSGQANEALDINLSREYVNNDRKRTSKDQDYGQKHDYAAKAKSIVTAELTEQVHAAPGKLGTQPETSVRTSKGRPRRQAKQSALEKLRAKHRKGDSQTADDITSDSADDGSEFDLPGESVKPASKRGPQRKQLPTPVTRSNAPKEAAGSKPQGKLKTAMSNHSAAATDTKHAQSKRIARGNPARSVTSAEGNITATRPDTIRPALPASSTKPSTSHQMTQQQAEQKSSPRRHGALKRPARALSRGRRPQTEDRYGFPENTSDRKRKGRSASRASRASTVKPGPTRQKMQSESVKERLDRANADLRVSSVPQPSRPRSGKAAVGKPASSTNTKKHLQPPSTHQSHSQTRDVTIASHQKPGSSQANAITIEQGSPSSSSSSPSPHRRKVIHSKAIVQVSTQRTKTVRPQTPALVRSSPPSTGTISTYVQAKDKPTIIAFGRHGPRNQGTSSAIKAARPDTSAKVLPDHDLEKSSTRLWHGETNELDSEHASHDPHLALLSNKRTTRVADAGNILSSNKDVNARLNKSPRHEVMTNILQSSPQVGIGNGQDDQHDGFALIDAFDDTTLVNDSEQSPEATKQPSTSQLAMQPPKAVSKDGESLSTAEAPTRMRWKQASKAVTAKGTPRPLPAAQNVIVESVKNEPGFNSTRPPVIKVDVPDDSPPAYSARLASNTLAANSPASQSAVNQRTRKRAQIVPSEDSPSKKRKPLPKGYVREVAKGTELAQDGGSLTRISKVHQTGFLETLKKGPALEAVNDRNVQSQDPAKRSDRRKNRTGRRTTQGSQGVDILGSPYPKELEVPIKTTALEVYSQKADLSSDQIHESSTALERSLDLEAVPRLEPTTRSGIPSSNGRPVPAAPQDSSKAVTRIASGSFAERLLNSKSADTSDDPFNTSSLVRNLKGPSADRYKAALRKHGIVLKDQASDKRKSEDGDQVDDTDRTLVHLFENARKQARDFTNSPTDERQSEKEGQVDYSDRSLMEDVEDAHKETQDVTISPVASEGSRASSIDTTTKALEDVGDWRNSLKPHQTHLFDSLVIAAHKLVRHMVDQETAKRTFVADYRRRGEIIVSEFHRKHAEEYQQYIQSKEGSKKQAADKLAKHSRELKQIIKDTEKARAERKRMLLARNEVDDVLKELAVGFEG